MAYVLTANARLNVVDISDPRSPRITGSCLVSYFSTGITLSGHFAYIANGWYGLMIVDIADPTHPVPMGSCRTDLYGVSMRIAVAGDYAYLVVLYSGLQVISIADPANPTTVGEYVCGNSSFEDVAVAGDYAYVADRYNGLRVLGISDPTNPVPVAGPIGGQTSRIAISGGRAYMLDSSDPGVTVTDVSDPLQPGSIGLYEPFDSRDVAASGCYIYTLDATGALVVLSTNDLGASSVSPRFAAKGSVAALGVSGTGFLSGATVKMTRVGRADVNASNVTVVGPNNINCKVNLGGAGVGMWDIVVTNPGASSCCMKGALAVVLSENAPVVGAANSAAWQPIMASACESRQFKFWGKVTDVNWDTLTFVISDGSKAPVTVYAPDSLGLVYSGCYASVTGTVDSSSRTVMSVGPLIRITQYAW
jgi:hypothetical protein